MKNRLTVIALLCAASAAFTSSAYGWEETPRRNIPQTEVQTIESEQIDIAVKDGWIYITTQKPIQIKIFNILGQIISSDTIQPGTHRIHMSSRGIYILRAGNVTRRVTI